MFLWRVRKVSDCLTLECSSASGNLLPLNLAGVQTKTNNGDFFFFVVVVETCG